jgi:hypothetical protein
VTALPGFAMLRRGESGEVGVADRRQRATRIVRAKRRDAVRQALKPREKAHLISTSNPWNEGRDKLRSS